MSQLRPSDALPIDFVISAPRSGSTWLSLSLDKHPQVFATENRFFGDHVSILPDAQGEPLPRITLDKFARALSQHFNFRAFDLNRAQFLNSFQQEYFEFMVRYSLKQSHKQFVIDKITPYDGTTSLVLEGIRGFFPAARIVRLIRDGRDVATSGVFDWLTKDAHGTPRHAFFVEGTHPGPLPRFFDDDTIKRWASNWKETNQELGASGRIVADVRYEEMESDHAGAILSVFNGLGISCDEETAGRCADETTFEKTSGRKAGDMNPLAKARRGVSGDWRNFFTRQDGRLFAEVAGAHLIELGYESNPTWFDRLPERLDLEPPPPATV